MSTVMTLRIVAPLAGLMGTLVPARFNPLLIHLIKMSPNTNAANAITHSRPYKDIVLSICAIFAEKPSIVTLLN